ncbi:MAG TPA: hypothetical protein VE621_05465 [Bryobacteraceae bacterium]|nr:hypothetical protein [Bryobacteraceae bacterium]
MSEKAIKQKEPVNELSRSMIRLQVDRILASEIFSRSERLSGFLKFIVEQTLEGRGDGLKEQVIGAEFYGKGPDFDGAADSVVRVDARRLRDKLREYYSEFGQEPVIISLRKGAYVPSFERNPAAPTLVQFPVQEQPAPVTISRRRNWTHIGVAVALLATACGTAFWFAVPKDQRPTVRLAPLVSHPYNEGPPSLSPDGTMVAFACAPAGGSGPTDICVRAVGTETDHRVTDTPQSEVEPAWSPDGQHILFVRVGAGIFIVSHLGGPDRKVWDSGSLVGWMPDGESILVRQQGEGGPRIYRVYPDTGEKRWVTSPPVGIGDWTFAASPNGRVLAFVGVERPGVADLYVVPIEGGPPRRLTDWNHVISNVAWTADGRELIYSAGGRLWRIPAYGSRIGRGTPIGDIPAPVDRFSMSRPGRDGTTRIAFRSSHREDVLHVIDLEAPLVDGKIEAGHPIAASTRVDFPGAFSRDARMIAFVSTRANMTGYELWIGHPDGTGLRQVTSLAAAALVVGSWSPDGERIAFDAAVAGNSDIYVSSVHGGKPVQLTFAPSLDGQPEWSLDGKWIYFSSKATGRTPELWKVPSSGGPPEQVTHGGGFEPKFSPNGQYLYYLDRPPNGAGSPKDVSKLLRMPAAGGEAELVHDRVPPFHWSISTKGIHFLTQDESGNVYLDLYRFSDEKVVRTGQLSFRIATLPGRFIVSRDGRWALTSQTKRADADLMLLEKFR